jgi:hypothetical protein
VLHEDRILRTREIRARSERLKIATEGLWRKLQEIQPNVAIDGHSDSVAADLRVLTMDIERLLETPGPTVRLDATTMPGTPASQQ